MWPALTIFYSSWLPKEYVEVYKDLGDEIMSDFSESAKTLVRKLIRKMSLKKLTKEGNERKGRIVEALFYYRNETLLHLNLYIEILPIFKSFVLTFEQKEPLIHRIFDEQVELVKTLLACFIRPEMLPEK